MPIDIESKLWGVSQLIYRDHWSELFELRIQAGGYSSRHHHKLKMNAFWIQEGQLDILLYEAVEQVDGSKIRIEKYTLLPEQAPYCIAVNDQHRFFARTPVVCYEWYKAIPGYQLTNDDIFRVDLGGIQKAHLDYFIELNISSSSASISSSH